jgi:hypothetical protein
MESTGILSFPRLAITQLAKPDGTVVAVLEGEIEKVTER